MAMVGLILGGLLGFGVGTIGWVAFDLALLSAITLYLCTSLGMMMLMIIIGAARSTNTPPQSSAEAVQN